jgi:hypothetical protein
MIVSGTNLAHPHPMLSPSLLGGRLSSKDLARCPFSRPFTLNSDLAEFDYGHGFQVSKYSLGSVAY